jgi:hypothetical protein
MRHGWFISDNRPGKCWKSGQKPAIVLSSELEHVFLLSSAG